MPILGVTDQRAAFPRLGILRKGAKKTGKRPGQDLTFFRFVSDDQDITRAFFGAYGAEPRRINVYLPFAAKDENLEAWMEQWGSGSLKHRCDGKDCVIWQDDTGQYHDTPEPCPGGCKPVGRLMVIIPELERLAYVQVLTTSWWDCHELAANLAAAEETVNLMGRDLLGVPFVLTRVPRMISTPPREEGGKRMRAEKWLLHIEPAPSWVKLQIEAARQRAAPQPLLESPEDIPAPNGDTVDAEVIEVESPEEGEAPAGEPENGNGKKLYFSPDFVKRIKEMIAEIRTLGGTKTVSDRVLENATMDELKQLGAELRQYIDELVERQANGDRPRNPADLRLWLHGKCGGDDGTPATEKQIPFVARKFQEAFAPNEDARGMYHDSLEWLSGERSAKGLTLAWARAILDWLLDPAGPDETGDTPLHTAAADEARRVYRQVLADCAQQDMSAEEDEIPF